LIVTEIRWVLASACGLFFVICLSINISAAVRWYRARKTGSGVWFAGSIVAFGGALLLPIGTLTQRIFYAFLPLVFEIMLFAAFWVVDRYMTRDHGDAA
jgi:hypothetical protein